MIPGQDVDFVSLTTSSQLPAVPGDIVFSNLSSWFGISGTNVTFTCTPPWGFRGAMNNPLGSPSILLPGALVLRLPSPAPPSPAPPVPAVVAARFPDGGSPSSDSNHNFIIGIVVGLVGATVVSVAAVVYWRSRRKKQAKENDLVRLRGEVFFITY